MYFTAGHTMKQKILIVEDHADAANMLALLLAREGYNTIYAQNGREGFDLATKENPNLVLTDLQMPEVNGVEFVKLLRNQAQFNKMPIIIVTAYRTKEFYEAMYAGANDVIFKPIFYDRLVDAIKKWLPDDEQH